MSAGAVGGILVTITALAVLVAEFHKSGDISLNAFMRDTAYAVLATIVGTFAITKLWESGQGLCLPDYLMSVVVLVDAWFSPVNSFRTALRNWSANVGGPATD